MDGSAASILPVELWIKIARTIRDNIPCVHASSTVEGPQCLFTSCQFKDTSAIRPLSESCRFLCVIVRPILWGSINLDRHTPRQLATLTSTLSAQPDLCTSVRSLNIQRLELSSSFLQALPLLVGVRSLSLTSGVIDQAIIELLRNAIHLCTLHMINFTRGKDTPSDWSRGGRFGENLKELVLYDWDAQPHHPTRNAQLFVPTVERLRVLPFSIVEFMKLPTSLPFGRSLLQLHIQTHDTHLWPALRRLLEQCPNMEKLVATVKLEGDHVEGGHVDASFVPKLRVIMASISFVMALLPGRPIRSIFTTANLRMFANPLPDLEVLSLIGLAGDESHLAVIDALLVACPRLVSLEMWSSKAVGTSTLKRWIETRLVSDLAALPRLQILHLKFDYRDVPEWKPIQFPLSEEMQRDRDTIVWVKMLHCPDLYDVLLPTQHAWKYSKHHDTWTPSRRIGQ